MGVFLRKVHPASQPLVGPGSGHAVFPPEGVKNLVGLPPFEPQHLIGHVAQGTVGPLMAAHPGVAVLAEVDVLIGKAQPVGGGPIDFSGRNQSNHTAAVAADGGNFHLCPPPTPLSFLRAAASPPFSAVTLQAEHPFAYRRHFPCSVSASRRRQHPAWPSRTGTAGSCSAAW